MDKDRIPYDKVKNRSEQLTIKEGNRQKHQRQYLSLDTRKDLHNSQYLSLDSRKDLDKIVSLSCCKISKQTSFRVIKENVVFETVQSGPYSFFNLLTITDVYNCSANTLLYG